MLSYDRLQWLRYGILVLRRWEKRWVLLFVTSNIWIDQLIGSLLNNGQEVVLKAHSWIGQAKDNVPAWLLNWKYFKKGVVDVDLLENQVLEAVAMINLIKTVLLIISVFFWIRILRSLAFVYADYHCSRMEGQRRQYFYVVAFIFNLVIYYFLIQFSNSMELL